jgi:hypothetical protein
MKSHSANGTMNDIHFIVAGLESGGNSQEFKVPAQGEGVFTGDIVRGGWGSHGQLQLSADLEKPRI